ncbi:MAG: hypothetical protein IJ600_12860 [Lachnospiraceae bacterium]|nr:hypothetical protein [Lachnospiraceae bacterium]
MARVNSKIENCIEEIEDEIRNSKFALFSSTHLAVNKENIEILLRNLRASVPEEIEHYRKIISNKEAIERQAREDAEKIRDDMRIQAEEILSDSEIMAQAQARADDLIAMAVEEAKSIREEALYDRQVYLSSAQDYLNDMLQNLNNMICECIDATTRNTQKFMGSLNDIGQTVQEDLYSLNHPEEEMPPQDMMPQESAVPSAEAEPKSIFENADSGEDA